MLLTIGHSTHSFEHFLALLQAQNVEVLADVRSVPASRYTPQFNGTILKNALQAHGIRYVWLEDLGGRPKKQEYIDAQGHANYAAMSKDPDFLTALSRLERGVAQYRVAAMCSEENPNECHRRLLVVHTLCQTNPLYTDSIQHIRGDGSLMAEAMLQQPQQDNWFLEEARPWRSPKPIPLGSPEKVQSNFSDY